MILADSSALIEYFRPGGLPAIQQAVATAIVDGELAFNGIIYVEVAGFALDERQRRALEASFGAFQPLPLTEEDFQLAASVGFALRRRGRTVPATDLIIAASAIHAGAVLLHTDNHFDEIAAVSKLVCRNPARPA